MTTFGGSNLVRRWIYGLLASSLLVTGLIAAEATADDPTSWARLSYPTHPLVQQGSGNLLPNPGWQKDLKSWDISGDVTVIDRDGETCLRFGPKSKTASAIRVYAPPPKPNTLYLLRFEAKLSADASAQGQAEPSPFGGWLAVAVRGGSSVATKIEESRCGTGWQKREFRLFSGSRPKALYVLADYHGTRGMALTRRWELVEQPVSVSEGRLVLETPSGDWAEMPRPPQPPAPPRPVLWAPEDPDRLAPYSAATDQDATRTLELAATPGEMCVAAVGLRSPTALEGVRVRISVLRGDSGELHADSRWKQIVFRPRRTDFYGRGRTFHVVPDCFVERPEGAHCPAGQTIGFWLNLRIGEDARPGLYRGRVTVLAGDKELSLPVRVCVYPFHLADVSDQVRHLYLDSGRWSKMTDPQILAELADLKDHGYESISVGCGGSLRFQSGHVVGFQLAEQDRRAIRLTRQARLKGPLLFWAGRLPAELAARLQLPRQIVAAEADTWPSSLAEAMVEALREMKAALGREGVADPVLDVVDEPGYWKPGSPQRLAWDIATAHRAGWSVYCTSSYLPSDPLGQGLEYHCYGSDVVTKQQECARAVASQTRAAGQKFWYYATGSYSGQIGNMLRNRYLAGFFFYRLGADGTASWTFQRVRHNAFDDFATANEQDGSNELNLSPCITYPDPEHPGANLDTPTWEGLRQAWYDYRYAATLQQAIARQRQKDPEAAERAGQLLTNLLAELPWNGDPFLRCELDNRLLSSVRRRIAGEILALGGDSSRGCTTSQENSRSRRCLRKAKQRRQPRRPLGIT